LRKQPRTSEIGVSIQVFSQHPMRNGMAPNQISPTYGLSAAK